MARSDLWTREQLIMALNVYFKIPFKDVKEKHTRTAVLTPSHPNALTFCRWITPIKQKNR